MLFFLHSTTKHFFFFAVRQNTKMRLVHLSFSFLHNHLNVGKAS